MHVGLVGNRLWRGRGFFVGRAGARSRLSESRDDIANIVRAKEGKVCSATLFVKP